MKRNRVDNSVTVTMELISELNYLYPPCIEARQAAKTAPTGSMYTASMPPPKTAATAICLAVSFQSVILVLQDQESDEVVRPTPMRFSD